MTTITPRAVFVTRETDFELLLARHATRGQARFFLESRGQRLEDVETLHDRIQAVLRHGRLAVPEDWRQAQVRRADLDRFLFSPEDVIVAVGQDGLVANVAKYLGDQPVLGVNPAPDIYDGVLARLDAERLPRLLKSVVRNDTEVELRTMVEATFDTGEHLRALNEIFVGHRSHQSARYRLETGDTGENQSSSGLIVSSGTGATGWARSIMEATHTLIPLDPQERAVTYFVREPFPSKASATTMRSGKLSRELLSVTSRMNEGGTVFADGLEQDHVDFDWGRHLSVGPSAQPLRLVTG